VTSASDRISPAKATGFSPVTGRARSDTPTRGYSWAPFAPGNTVTLQHGAYSPRTWKPLADQIAAELPDVAPWCCRPAYGSAVAAWSRTEAQIVLLMGWLDEHGPLDDEGVPRPATGLLATLERQAQSLRAELGLTPLALAKLLGALTSAPAGTDDQALERLRAEGRQLVEARAAAEAGDADDGE
jgi:hypothetical protein